MTVHLLLSFYQGMFDSRELKLPDHVSYKKDINQKGQFWAKLKEFMNDGDIVCEEIFVNAIKYQKGDLLVNQVLDGAETLKMVGSELFWLKAKMSFLLTLSMLLTRISLAIMYPPILTPSTCSPNLRHWRIQSH